MKRKNKFYLIIIPAIIYIFVNSCVNSNKNIIQAPSDPALFHNAGRSVKRGIGFGFDRSYAGTAAADMALMAPGVSWFYNWSIRIPPTVEGLAVQNNVMYVPMVWNSRYTSADMEALSDLIKRSEPKIEYIMAYNEPMYRDQARMTPQQAAADWPRLKQFAKDNNLKIIGPALNWGNYYEGCPPGRDNPKGWFQTFIEQDEVELSDMAGIAIHCYMNYPGSNKWWTSWEFREYGLPIWVTEFCAWDWEWPSKNFQTPEWQMKYMSEACIYYEQDPMIASYAWFMPRGNLNRWPYHDLVSGYAQNAELTDLGKIYVNMSSCDRELWTPAGMYIAASDFNANHLSTAEYQNANKWFDPGTSGLWDDFHLNGGFGGSVHFRPNTDTQENAPALEAYNFTRNKWQEYQYNLPSEKNYTFFLRYKTVSPVKMEITVDGKDTVNVELNSAEWHTAAFDLGNIQEGNRIIRLKVISGNCTLSWIKAE